MPEECTQTYEELFEHLINPKVTPDVWKKIFFNGVPPRHLTHLSIDDDLVRCIKCGKTIDEHPREAKRAREGEGETLNESEVLPSAKAKGEPAPRESKPFDLDHLRSIKPDSWVDISRDMPFTGRIDFVDKVQEQMKQLTSDGKPIGTNQSSFSLVYSTVSGSGKTVAMLHLKEAMKESIVAYLGFNSGVSISDEEENHINNHSISSKVGAKEVLARRLVGSVVLSMKYPDVVYKVPQYEEVYKGRAIPTVDESFKMLLSALGASPGKPTYIVAGVDEVQVLDNMSKDTGMKVDRVGLGRFFLRILREWQVNFYDKGLRILPLGTGIAVDWSADPTQGRHISLHGGDSVLISKDSFKRLTQQVVERTLGEVLLNRLNAQRERAEVKRDIKRKLVDLISAAYWPRVRLLEWLRDGYSMELEPDANASQWPLWLDAWFQDIPLSVEESKGDHVPGKDSSSGAIYALFEMQNPLSFKVIPDGLNAKSIVRKLDGVLPSELFDGLEDTVPNVKSIHSFLTTDEHVFEENGFFVLGSALWLALESLKRWRLTKTLSDVQEKRLGLAYWVVNTGAETSSKPTVVGASRVVTRGNFYPFTSASQVEFSYDFKTSLIDTMTSATPLFVRCGKQTCCDYVFCFVHCGKSQDARKKLVAVLVDAKHTKHNDATITTENQQQIYDAANKFRAAFGTVKHKEVPVEVEQFRLMFLTNRTKVSASTAHSKIGKDLDDAKQELHKTHKETEMKLLNNDTFDFGPFSDVLMTQGHHVPDLST